MLVKSKRGGLLRKDNADLKDPVTTSLSIGEIAKHYGLSRSTLLYYDAIGLLRPSGRNKSNYRRYTGEDSRRLRLICMYRQVGLSMAAIAKILESPQGGVRDILEKRLLELGQEISGLRAQQHVIIRMLGDKTLRDRTPVMDKENWVSLLRAAGLDDEAMGKWHAEFEKLSPLLHQEFLEGLGIPNTEIALIRRAFRSR
jgi:MerR family transcriptional regulator, thiopeptide resistance regulator